jgi:hypothetical protein
MKVPRTSLSGGSATVVVTVDSPQGQGTSDAQTITVIK